MEIENKNEIEDRKYCVYVHTSPSGKKYVGQTGMKPEHRWRNGGAGYLYQNNKTGEYKQPAFARAILKYGWDNFKHEIIANNLTKEEADALEKSLIDKLNTMNPKRGYNCREGGNGSVFSEEARIKMSESHKGVRLSEETRRKIGDAHRGEKNHNYGKHLSEETRRKLSESHMGHTHTEESKKKISKAISGENHYLYGKHRSEETKRKLSESHKGLMAGVNHPQIRKVVQYDMQGNLVKIWDYMNDAATELQICPSNICNCCKNEKKTAGGFIWRYFEDKLTEEHIAWCNRNEGCVQIAQCSLSGEIICTFKSIKEAELKTGIGKGNICSCCKGDRKSAGGFIWKYYDDIGESLQSA